MRIVSGRHRGRTITAPGNRRIRPTSERMREALFNMLEHRFLGIPSGGMRPSLRETRFLDAFCGTGALGLEALSRGAPCGVFMDIDAKSIEACRRNVRILGEEKRASILHTDCLDPAPPAAPCAILFMDPPYGRELAPAALVALDAAGWLVAGALCFVETGLREPLPAPPAFRLLDERRYGAALLRVLERHPTDALRQAQPQRY